jgi:8-oxo-dGTP pyrophosphatase MutT (NUDIX family)
VVRALTAKSRVVRAAGGVVGRTTPDGDTELVLVHRPKYDDWSLPKGKRDPAETDEQCAVREVEEETGLRCRLGPELLPTSYTDAKGRPKVVRYWSMSVVGERPFVPGAEIDEMRWLSVDAAIALLSYDHDAEVVRSFATPRVGEL